MGVPARLERLPRCVYQGGAVKLKMPMKVRDIKSAGGKENDQRDAEIGGGNGQCDVPRLSMTGEVITAAGPIMRARMANSLQRLR